MELQDQPHLSDYDTTAPTSHDHGSTTSSTAALKLQKVYKSYRTRRKLADSAVVVEELWWQALDFARLNHSTISFFDYVKNETAASRWSRIRLNASRVGKGLSKDAMAQKLAFQHWIEAIDPRHRYGHNLNLYYEEWCKGDAGQPFFYWLDVGDGKEVELKQCPRSRLRRECIRYLGPQEREHYEYIIVEGTIVHKLSGDLLDTNGGLEGSKWIFVMSTSKRLYAGQKRKGLFHHSSFLAGGATLAAGRLMAEGGKLRSVSAYSGHYRPTDGNLSSFLVFLKEHGVNLDGVQVCSYKTVEELSKTGLSADAELPKLRFPVMRKARPLNHLNLLKLHIAENEVQEGRLIPIGDQLSLKWSTGAGPRIGCVADYPLKLRVQAFEMVDLTPKDPPRQLASKLVDNLTSLGSSCKLM
ncbi:hypothetical protein AAG906_014342 [Vitis piasezkii]